MSGLVQAGGHLAVCEQSYLQHAEAGLATIKKEFVSQQSSFIIKVIQKVHFYFKPLAFVLRKI